MPSLEEIKELFQANNFVEVEKYSLKIGGDTYVLSKEKTYAILREIGESIKVDIIKGNVVLATLTNPDFKEIQEIIREV